MISRRLVGQIESNASKLAMDVVETVLASGRANSYREKLARDEYYRLVLDLYSHLGSWLHSRSWHKLEFQYENKGRDRFACHMPISEVVYSISQTKARLFAFIRGSMEGDASERDLEVELLLGIAEFFDRAIFHTVHGYEDARRVAADRGCEELPDSAPALATQASSAPAEGDLSVSRAGEMGELPG